MIPIGPWRNPGLLFWLKRAEKEGLKQKGGFFFFSNKGVSKEDISLESIFLLSKL